MEKRDEVIVRVSAVIFSDGGKLLLSLRPGPPMQGYWHLPGGTLRFGETLHQALRRSVWEEVGIAADPDGLQPAFVGQMISPAENCHIIDHFFPTESRYSSVFGRGKSRHGFFTETEARTLKTLDSCKEFLRRSCDWRL